MNYYPEIAGFEGQKIDAQVSFWSGPKLLINGAPAAKGAKRGEMLLQRNDGGQVTAKWKLQLLGLDTPQLVVGEQTINLVEPLKWYQWAWGGLPALLLFAGGGLGAIAGLIGFSLSLKVFRSQLSAPVKYLLSAVVSILAIVIYIIVGTLFSMLVHG
jgi:hypothetical protein